MPAAVGSRQYVKGEGRQYQPIGPADDIADADGVHVLSFDQAQEAAREWLRSLSEPTTPTGPMTVRRAVDAYISYLKLERRSGEDTGRRLKLHVLSKPLADRPVAELTQSEIETWRNGMVRRDDADPDAERRSKDTANRVLTMLKAALNRVFRDDANQIPTDKAWRTVKPFHDVGLSRQEYLDPQQSRRLINACRGRFRHLVTAAFLTGARPPGELAGLKAKYLRADLRILHIPEGKTGPRDVVLTEEAARWFEGIAAGKQPDDLLLPKDDGTAWGFNHHLRRMRDAVKRAKLPKATTIYACRHSYVSQSLLSGMNMQLLAENMGTSVRMIEQHYGKFIAASRRKLIEETAPKLGVKPSNIRSMQPRKKPATDGKVVRLHRAP